MSDLRHSFSLPPDLMWDTDYKDGRIRFTYTWLPEYEYEGETIPAGWQLQAVWRKVTEYGLAMISNGKLDEFPFTEIHRDEMIRALKRKVDDEQG